jgi:hypothetical protein
LYCPLYARPRCHPEPSANSLSADESYIYQRLSLKSGGRAPRFLPLAVHGGLLHVGVAAQARIRLSIRPAALRSYCPVPMALPRRHTPDTPSLASGGAGGNPYLPAPVLAYALHQAFEELYSPVIVTRWRASQRPPPRRAPRPLAGLCTGNYLGESVYAARRFGIHFAGTDP